MFQRFKVFHAKAKHRRAVDLGDIATSIMTVVSIVFAIVLMTLTLASMQFSPRMIVRFSRDRSAQFITSVMRSA